ncbi:MAG: hypothetical protein WA948_01955 [Pontixanthobacter sp.]
MRNLIRHPDCPAGPVTAVSAAIEPTPEGCRADFRIEGEIAKMRIDAEANPERSDTLWRTTCCEVFWQPQGGTAYREFNLSPSRRWAAYDFDDMRENRQDAEVGDITIACHREDDALILRAEIKDALVSPAAVALNAIVEDQAGNLQYWALAFADGPVDFHRRECRTLRLAGAL